MIASRAGGAETEDRDTEPSVGWAWTLVVVLLAGTSIGALLAEVYGVVDMATFGRWLTIPGAIALLALGSGRVVGGPRGAELVRRLRVGAVAGVLGTVGYDVVRIPFAAIGYRLFAPIDSYGLFLAGGSMSSPGTQTLGWLYHLSNGVTFGIAYVAVAARRHWAWGVGFGVFLEAMVVATPFRERYALTDWVAIGLAFGAHVPFGLALGRMGQQLDAADAALRRTVSRPALAILGLAVAAIVVWQAPWRTSAAQEQATDLAARVGRPVAVVERDAFVPEWLRVDRGGCITVSNRGDQAFTTPYGDVAPGADSELCFPDAGVVRVKLGPRAYSGGFVDVRD